MDVVSTVKVFPFIIIPGVPSHIPTGTFAFLFTFPSENITDNVYFFPFFILPLVGDGEISMSHFE